MIYKLTINPCIYSTENEKVVRLILTSKDHQEAHLVEHKGKGRSVTDQQRGKRRHLYLKLFYTTLKYFEIR